MARGAAKRRERLEHPAPFRELVDALPAVADVVDEPARAVRVVQIVPPEGLPALLRAEIQTAYDNGRPRDASALHGVRTVLEEVRIALTAAKTIPTSDALRAALKRLADAV